MPLLWEKYSFFLIKVVIEVGWSLLILAFQFFLFPSLLFFHVAFISFINFAKILIMFEGCDSVLFCLQVKPSILKE